MSPPCARGDLATVTKAPDPDRDHLLEGLPTREDLIASFDDGSFPTREELLEGLDDLGAKIDEAIRENAAELDRGRAEWLASFADPDWIAKVRAEIEERRRAPGFT